jgi:hypothetical protein
MPAIAPWRPPAAPEREVHPPPVLGQLFRDLTAGRTAADHEDGSVGKLGRRPVRACAELKDPLGHVAGRRWASRLLEGSSRDDDDLGVKRAIRRGEPVAPVCAPRDRDDVHASLNWSAERLCVRLQVAYDLIPGHELVWLVAAVAAAGQLKGPVRRVQEEAVPALASPRFGNAGPFEHDVLAAPLR